MFNLVFVLQFCIAGFIIKPTIGRKMFSTEDKILRFVCTVALYSNPVYRHIKTYLYQLVYINLKKRVGVPTNTRVCHYLIHQKVYLVLVCVCWQ